MDVCDFGNFRYKESKISAGTICYWFGAIWRAWSPNRPRLSTGKWMDIHLNCYKFLFLISFDFLCFLFRFDCIKIVQGFCSNLVVNIPVGKITVHENYVPTSITQEHDIALIRLQNPAPYTDFIRPICLPLGRLQNKNLDGLPLTVAGFGRTENGIIE